MTKYCIVCHAQFSDWVEHGRIFDTIEDAEKEAFKLRSKHLYHKFITAEINYDV